MKLNKKIIFAVLMVIALAAMFLPVAQFPENTGEIEKQQGKVDSAQTQPQRWIDGGKKSEADIQKQRDKVQKEQDKLDALLAEQEAASGEAGGGLSYALLPGQLPADIEVDMSVVNQYKLYETWNMADNERISEVWNFQPFYLCVWAGWCWRWFLSC